MIKFHNQEVQTAKATKQPSAMSKTTNHESPL